MAEADAGGASGNGAAPTAVTPTSENVPQAQGAAAAFTKEQTDAIAAAVAKEVAGIKDSIFAEARRTFTEKRSKPKDESPSTPVAPSASDPHEERRVLRDFDRSLNRSGLADKVSAAQYSRAEKALLAERPDDVASWVSDYFAGFGTAPAAATTPATAPAAPPKPTNERPVTDRGAPPAAKTEDPPLRSMAPDDLKALIQKIGPVEYRKRLFAELNGTTVQVRRQ